MEKEKFTIEQIRFIEDHGADITDTNDIFDKISDLLCFSGFDEDYHITAIGKICEEILDVLAEED